MSKTSAKALLRTKQKDLKILVPAESSSSVKGSLVDTSHYCIVCSFIYYFSNEYSAIVKYANSKASLQYITSIGTNIEKIEYIQLPENSVELQLVDLEVRIGHYSLH